jgi:hypothetical protein
MPVSLQTVLILFSFLIDLKEMPIDKYNRQLLPESKSTQIGKPAWEICKYAMLWPCCSLFPFKTLLFILDTCVIFLRLFCSAFISFHSAFISFHSAFIWQRAFVQVSLSARKGFIIALLFKSF